MMQETDEALAGTSQHAEQKAIIVGRVKVFDSKDKITAFASLNLLIFPSIGAEI